MIDHTLLRPEATPAEVERLCAEALHHGFASVCVNPSFVHLCARLLKGSPVRVCTVVGFPLGATTTTTKVQEARTALDEGATEIDMVIHVGMLKAADNTFVREDIAAVAAVVHERSCILKVILETSLLNEEEIVRACLLARAAEADFVKTSTGFGKGGATPHDIALMRRAVGSSMGVKASGGIRTYADAASMIAAGATRIGASASVQILAEAKVSPRADAGD
jgi:deoxyribose-phosphate aldolase